MAAYPLRPPYPEVLLEELAEQLGEPGGALLDLGCGLGEISRRLAASAGPVTAIDASQAMLAQARRLPGGESSLIRWICAPVEEAPLAGPYSAVLAAESFHWFDWAALVPRLIAVVPSRRLLLIERSEVAAPWKELLMDAIIRYSTNLKFRPYEIVHELSKRGLFIEEGRRVFGPDLFTQSVADYVESFHSRNGFSRDRMEPAEAASFDQRVVDITSPFTRAGSLDLQTCVTLVWGRLAGDE